MRPRHTRGARARPAARPIPPGLHPGAALAPQDFVKDKLTKDNLHKHILTKYQEEKVRTCSIV